VERRSCRRKPAVRVTGEAVRTWEAAVSRLSVSRVDR